MKKNSMENKIYEEFSRETPDLLSKIMERCEEETQVLPSESGTAVLDTTPTAKKRRRYSFGRIATVAAMLLIVFSVGLLLGNFVGLPKIDGDVANVYIDVNPSVELVVLESGYVKKCIASNADAEKILSGMNLDGVEVQTAVNAIIGSMYMNGYITTDASNSILVSAKSDSDKFSGLLESIVSDVNTAMQKANIPCAIIARNVENDKSTETMASENNISLGKMSLIKKIVDKLEVYTDDDIETLAKMSIKELNLIYTAPPEITKPTEGDDKFDIPGPGDDEHDEDEIISGKVEEYLDREIALDRIEDAMGIDDDDMRMVRLYAMPKLVDGNSIKMVYVVSFLYLDRQYEYEVDCISGEVVLLSNTDFETDRPTDPPHPDIDSEPDRGNEGEHGPHPNPEHGADSIAPPHADDGNSPEK